MKKFLIGIMIVVLPTSIFGIGGIGLQIGQGSVTVGATEDAKVLGLGITANMTTTEFSNPLSVGLHVYIDAIPFIDLEADINLVGQKYEFGFNNPAEIGPYEFVWGSASTYFTVRKKILGLGIPFLAKANLFYGGGYNQHMVTPLMTIDLMEEMMKGEDPLAKLRRRGSPSEDELNGILDKIIQNNMELVKKRGERAVVTLMGIAMKEMRGKFSGKRVNDLLRKKILEF